MEGLGAGLAAFAFWGFIAAVVVGGIWYSIREKETQHETLRRIIESGQKVDERLVEKIVGSDRVVHRDLRIGGMITLSTAPGLAILGWFLGRVSEQALTALLGVAGLVGCVGIGLLVAASVAERSYRENNPSSADRNMAR